MTKKMSKFTDIGQFRSVIKNIINQARFEGLDADGEPIYNHTADCPVVTFKGTVKIHGSNLGVAYNEVDGLWVQSRSNIITPEKDNAGSAFDVMSKKDVWVGLIKEVAQRENIDLTENSIGIFGEWAGGNIQKGVAINGLPKFVAIFDAKVIPFDEEKESYYVSSEGLQDNEKLIYNVDQFGTYEIEIDFERPDIAQNAIVKMVEQVEENCPCGKFFGVDGIGEGIVFTAEFKGRRYIFKAKGNRHSVTKTKTIAEVDTEKLDSILEFVDYAVTENRLNQMIETTFTMQGIEPDISKTGDYLRNLVNDVIKEESDTMTDNGLEPKEVNKYISTKGRKFFMEYLNRGVGL